MPADHTTDDRRSTFYGVFSAVAHRPVIRAWATSEQEARTKMAEIQTTDQQSERGVEDEYYTTRLNDVDVEGYKQAGFIPGDA